MAVPLNDEYEAVADAGPGGERAGILIVDDLPEKLLVFRALLEDMGQELVFAQSGKEALRQILEREFAVILLDVNMPDIDGFETATLIRRYRRSAHTPIIFITSYVDEMQTERGYSLGAVDYILSPPAPAILRSKIQVFVDLYLAQRRIRRQADERVALVAAETACRIAEANTRRADYLSHASHRLSEVLDVDVVGSRLLELLVPELGEWAAVMLKNEALDGEPSSWQFMQLRAGQAAPGREPLCFSPDVPLRWRDRLDSLIERCEPGHLTADELREHLPAGTRDVEDASDVPGRSVLLPLVAGERVLGVLGVASHEQRDWSLVSELANRVATKLENARLYRSLHAEIAERRAAQAQLQKSNQYKDEFLAMLSHELRNPLAPIRNAIEVMRRLAPSDPKMQWATQVMDRQTSHLTRLVDELLDVARISQGKITLHSEPVDLMRAISHGVETVRPFIELRRHTLTLQTPKKPVWLRGDFARLSQVVANLLNNAAKYTEAGGAIRLSLTMSDGCATLAVSDNGMGIEPELLPHVFDLFEQGRRSLDRSQGGLGVGLTLVQRIVELHHGRVEVRSAGAGHGTRFEISLPCMAEVSAPVEEDLHGGHGTDDPACRVLIVDDNVDAAESVAMMLRLHGHVVKALSDSSQALACARTFEPQAIILDIGLPGLDGYALARRLRAMAPTRDAMLIALTGYGQREDVTRALEAGFTHHFVKPTDPQVLADCIARGCRLESTDQPAEPTASRLSASSDA